MEVGEVRVAEDSDFQKLKSLCADDEGWRLEYENQKHATTVWTKSNQLSEFKMIKV